jgi:DNA-binding response OmpR family regulator
MASDEIAVIDDDRSCMGAVVDALRAEGYRVSTAFSGKDAMDLLSNASPALLILDIALSGVNGLRLLADFRRRDPKTPVIAMSDEDRASVHDQAMASGANAFLRKPFPIDILLSAVRRFAGQPAPCLF